jgi:imidazole glycerol-phosphate synthase subunit HisH
MQRVVIIDYGSGNLHSAAKAFEHAAHECGAEAQITVSARPEDVRSADRVVLPGVGAFTDCKQGLLAIPDMLDALEETVQRKARPFLGICVGMQLLATRGLEFEVTQGLSWIEGEVRAIEPSDPSLKIPHMGWNTLNPVATTNDKNTAQSHPLLQGITTGAKGQHAYFVHSYHFLPADRARIVAETDYGGPVTAIVAKENIAGTQFHPEKSQTLGLKFIANFLTWRPS